MASFSARGFLAPDTPIPPQWGAGVLGGAGGVYAFWFQERGKEENKKTDSSFCWKLWMQLLKDPAQVFSFTIARLYLPLSIFKSILRNQSFVLTSLP